MPSGYSANPLFKKLGLKEGFQVILVNAPVSYKALLGDIAEKLSFKSKTATGVDFIHLFTNTVQELEKALPVLKQQIKKDGMIWVSWYKKSSGKTTELTENMIRDTGLSSGLVDIKVCAVDEDWSGLKFVYRLKDR